TGRWTLSRRQNSVRISSGASRTRRQRPRANKTEKIDMTKTLRLGALALSGLAGSLLLAADPPSADITNGVIKAKVCLPDRENGFYRSTRFDWSGIICQMEYKGKVFYSPWWYKLDLMTYDFGYDDKGVISAPFT